MEKVKSVAQRSFRGCASRSGDGACPPPPEPRVLGAEAARPLYVPALSVGGRRQEEADRSESARGDNEGRTHRILRLRGAQHCETPAGVARLTWEGNVKGAAPGRSIGVWRVWPLLHNLPGGPEVFDEKVNYTYVDTCTYMHIYIHIFIYIGSFDLFLTLENAIYFV